MKSIAFIDNFIETPINHCVNEFIIRNQMPCTYHHPARFGFDSLNRLEKMDGIVILGSASHVTDPEPWHKELMEFVLPHIEKGTPTLGICFGHQLIAHHFGAQVDYIDEVQTYYQIVRDIKIHENMWGFSAREDFPMPYSHKQAVKTLPGNFRSTMSFEGLPYEGLKHDKYNLWTFQGHPESSVEFLEESLNISTRQERERIKTEGNKLLDSFANFVRNHII